MKLSFTYLVGFSGQGGIERFNRCFCRALFELSKTNNIDLAVSSLYDPNSIATIDIDPKIFSGFGKNRFLFFFYSIISAFNKDVIIFGHVNMAPVALLIRLLFPKKKIVLIAHGIDIWYKLSKTRSYFLSKLDYCITVSNFSKQKIVQQHGLKPDKIIVFQNTLDPHFVLNHQFEKPMQLIRKYNLDRSTKIIYTLTRISQYELYKGYDKVIEALGTSTKISKNYHYFIGGKFDAYEFARITKLIAKYHLQTKVHLLGYIPENELPDYYRLADVYVMPSKKEGFGIVFIEAAASGLHVIAGNKDGSVDALDQGKFGTLIDPDNIGEIQQALIQALENPKTIEQKIDLQNAVIEKYGFEAFKTRLKEIITKIQE